MHTSYVLKAEAVDVSHGLTTTAHLGAGQHADFILRWGAGSHSRAVHAPALLQATSDAWRRWMRRLTYDGPHPAVVRASVDSRLSP